MVLVFTIISGVGLISSPQSPPPGSSYGPLGEKPAQKNQPAQNMKRLPESKSCLCFDKSWDETSDSLFWRKVSNMKTLRKIFALWRPTKGVAASTILFPFFKTIIQAPIVPPCQLIFLPAPPIATVIFFWSSKQSTINTALGKVAKNWPFQ